MPNLSPAEAAKRLQELIEGTFPLQEGYGTHNICCSNRERNLTPRHKPYTRSEIKEFWGVTENVEAGEDIVGTFSSGRSRTLQVAIFYEDRVLLDEPLSHGYDEKKMRSFGPPSHEVVGEIFGEIKRTIREHSDAFYQTPA